METILNALKSKTILGLFLTTIGSTTIGSDLISTLGLTDESLLTMVNTAIQVFGGLLAVYGRAVAKAPLVKKDA